MTLVRVVLAPLDRESGEILWNGERIDDPADFFVPPTSAYTARAPRLQSESLRDNIPMGLDRSDEQILRALGASVTMDDLATFDEALDPSGSGAGLHLSRHLPSKASAAAS